VSKSPSLLRRLVEAADSGGDIDKENVMSNPQHAHLGAVSTWTQMEAERAFKRAARARRRAALAGRVKRRGRGLAVYDDTLRSATGARRGLHEIPLDAIRGTTEPNRAAQFDHQFRPAALTRNRWQRVWLAFHRGATLPPISVIQVGDEYAIRDGHHRVSVAKALGALTIPAVVA
jgi:hypothetical protein